jgi:hypothetical protein
MVPEYFLEDIANDYFQNALDIVKLDEPKLAIDYFSIVYGLYRQTENIMLMQLSKRWLTELGLTGYELNTKLNYSVGLARYCIDLVDSVNTILQHREP